MLDTAVWDMLRPIVYLGTATAVLSLFRAHPSDVTLMLLGVDELAVGLGARLLRISASIGHAASGT